MNNTIAKVQLHITAPSQSDGYDIQQTLSRLFWQELVSAMDSLFNRYIQPEDTYIIDKLDLDLGTLSVNDLQATFTYQFLNKLQDALAQLVKQKEKRQEVEQLGADNTDVTLTSTRQRLFDVWLYFLKTGTLPPSAPQIEETTWLKAVVETLTLSARAEQQFLRLLPQGRALERLVLQFDEAFLAQIASILTRSNWQKLPALRLSMYQDSEKIRTQQKEQALKQGFQYLHQSYSYAGFWSSLFQYIHLEAAHKMDAERAVLIPLKSFFQHHETLKNLEQAKAILKKIGTAHRTNDLEPLTDTPSVSEGFTAISASTWASVQKEINDIIQTRFTQTSLNTRPKTLKEQPKQSNKPLEKTGKPTDARVNYIQNAGVILTHAFLPTLFKELKLLDDKKQFKNESARHRAIHLIQYLGSGIEALPEYRLLLPKLLCGLPFDIPLERHVKLKKKEKAEADALLKAVIEHWGVLGKVSIEALREGFFNRECKLSQTDKGQNLKIEQRTEDILLARLPWSISMIKLPWMQEMLFVEWAS